MFFFTCNSVLLCVGCMEHSDFESDFELDIHDADGVQESENNGQSDNKSKAVGSQTFSTQDKQKNCMDTFFLCE